MEFAAMIHSLQAETSGVGDPDAINLASATGLKDTGNAAYKRRDFTAAATSYSQAARVVMSATDALMLGISRNPRAPSAALLRLRATLCCNRGALFLEVAKLSDAQLLREPLVAELGIDVDAPGAAAAVRARTLCTAEAMLRDALDNTDKPCPDDLRAKAEARLARVAAAMSSFAKTDADDSALPQPPPPVATDGGDKKGAMNPTERTFILPASTGVPAIPLRAEHRLDGFGRSALLLCYSSHLGLDALRWHAEQALGDTSPEALEFLANGDESPPWCIATLPVHDDAVGADMVPGEACFNLQKCGPEYEALKQAGIVTEVPGKMYKAGYYDPFPIAHINVPLHQENGEGGSEEEDGAAEDKI